MSEEISQVLAVLERVHSALSGQPRLTEEEVTKVRSDATNTIAKELGVHRNTVLDKYSRRMFSRVTEFDNQVWKWLRNGDPGLEEWIGIYLSRVRSPSTSVEEDREVVQRFFSRHSGGQRPAR